MSEPGPSRPPRADEIPQTPQANLTIRIVPYSPPRPSDDEKDDSFNSGSGASAAAVASHDDDVFADRHEAADSWCEGSPATVSTGRTEKAALGPASKIELHAAELGSALSSTSSSAVSLVRSRDGGVSGPSGAAPKTPPPAPAHNRPLYPSDRIAGTALHQVPGDSPPPPSSAASSQQLQSPFLDQPEVSATSPRLRPLSRRRNVVAINSDKTFTLVPQATEFGALRASGGSPPVSSTFSTLSTLSAASVSLDRPFSDVFSEDRPSSPLTTIADDYSEAPNSPKTPANLAHPSSSLAEDPISQSPWNYRMVGGLRKVPKTPDLKHNSTTVNTPSSVATDSTVDSLPPVPPLPPLPNAATITVASASVSRPPISLNPKQSFQSAVTLEETTNYKVYGQSSPVRPDDDSLLMPSSSQSNTNFVVLGQSSPAVSSLNNDLPVPPSSDIDSNENFVIHGNPSASASLVTLNRSLRPAASEDSILVSRGPQHQFSQESLVIPPLRVQKKKSFDKFGYYRQRSRESLRTPSLKSFTSVVTHEAAKAIFVAPTLIHLQSAAGPSSAQAGAALPAGSTVVKHQDPSWGGFSGVPLLPSSKRVRMEPHPHVWSSQLSTVMSESEGSEAPLSSRSPSAFSGSGPRSPSGRRSSGFSYFGAASTHSRQMMSISSSMAQEVSSGSGNHSRSHSRSDSLDRPQPAYTRSSPGPSRAVRDQDEHGDGLTDLHDLQSRPSRTRLSSLLGSTSSDRNLHSSASSRNGSFTSASLPAWARFYYSNGGGERRLLAIPSDSSLSESYKNHGTDSWRSNSPATDHFPLSIYSSRRRAREAHVPAVAGPSGHNRNASESGSLDVAEALPPMGDFRVHPIRRKPSSIWSPHLRFDRYASRYSVWDPPSVQWSAESGPMGRRNAQVVLFVLGFIIPFSWMIAAFLPLPPDPKTLLQQQMEERGSSSSRLDFPAEVEQTRNGAADESRYQSARWWRTLNRFMAVFGLLIIAAVIVLVIIGVRQKWGH